jgi:hypothetical protein
VRHVSGPVNRLQPHAYHTCHLVPRRTRLLDHMYSLDSILTRYTCRGGRGGRGARGALGAETLERRGPTPRPGRTRRRRRWTTSTWTSATTTKSGKGASGKRTAKRRRAVSVRQFLPFGSGGTTAGAAGRSSATRAHRRRWRCLTWGMRCRCVCATTASTRCQGRWLDSTFSCCGIVERHEIDECTVWSRGDCVCVCVCCRMPSNAPPVHSRVCGEVRSETCGNQPSCTRVLVHT